MWSPRGPADPILAARHKTIEKLHFLRRPGAGSWCWVLVLGGSLQSTDTALWESFLGRNVFFIIKNSWTSLWFPHPSGKLRSLNLPKLLLCFAMVSQCAVVAALLSAPSHTRATAPWRSVDLLIPSSGYWYRLDKVVEGPGEIQMQLNLRCKTRKSMTTEEGLVPWSGVGSRITCAVYPVLSPPCNQRWYSGSHYTLQPHNSPAQTILPTMGSTLLNPYQPLTLVLD